MSLSSLINVVCGKSVNLKDLKDGNITVHKNGSKTYMKDIESNLPDEDCILITQMSVDVIFVDKTDTKKHFASTGCVIITLKENKKETVLLKYLFFCFSAFGIIKELKRNRCGSCQQSISKNRMEDVFKSVGLTDL